MPSAWVIEDNDLNFELVDFLLVEEGWQVVRAHDGAGLVALLGAPPPDVVLLDMNLPDVSGLEILDRLRSDRRYSALPVVALTAHAMRGDRERFLAAGCDAYVSKPIDAAELFATLTRLLDRRAT